jgi:N-acyl-D-amino-acid deacylase
MNKFVKLFLLWGLVILPFIPLNSAIETTQFDLVIKNGKIVDGTGNPWFYGDIAVKGNKILEIGQIDKKLASKIINARGLIVSPGFIDVHTHCDRGITRVPTVDNYILQGVTTVVGGNCGGHPFPLEKLFARIKEIGISLNFACLIGHNTIRREVMEYRMEAPTEEEMARMKALIDQEMKAGGVGFSTGLSYLPGIYSSTQELVELASTVAPYGGIYATHLRDQGEEITEAIEEAIEVGRKNNIPVQISHVKLAQDDVWGKIEMITKPVENARREGIEVWLDQYPYTATSSGFTSSFPSEAFEGGRDVFLERMKDPKTYEEVKDFIIKRRLTSSKGIDKLKTIYIASYGRHKEYEGKNLYEILVALQKEPTVSNGADFIIEIEKNGGAQGVFFQMDETDVENIMRLPYNMHASDGGTQALGRGVPHPRNYGTFPRVIAHYVREKGVLTLEEAIRKMTSLPAQVFRLKNRGLIKEGMYADLTLFVYDSIKDNATFSKPHQYGQGLAFVIVNGEIVVEKNKHTGKVPGKILFGSGKTKGESYDH